MVQLGLIHAVLMNELGNPVGTDHCNDDPKQEVNAPCPLHHNDNLQFQEFSFDGLFLVKQSPNLILF